MFRTIGVGGGALMVFVVGCSGSTSSGVFPVDASVDAATDGGSVDASAGGYTLDNVCALTAPKVCAERSPCCSSIGGYDANGCIAYTIADCAKDVAEVKAGTMTFDGSKIDACLEKIGPVIAKCVIELSDLASVAATLNECKIFSGQRGEGQPCERDSQCKPSSTPDALVSCSLVTKKCTTSQFLGAGATCSYKEGFTAICGTGLYCDIPAAGQPGTCKTALSTNATCSKAKPLECGLGLFCNDALKCVKGDPGGGPCDNALQCASLKCDKTGDAGTGTCEPLKPLVKPAECGK